MRPVAKKKADEPLYKYLTLSETIKQHETG